MKILKLISQLEFLVEDDEAESVARNFGRESLLKLRCGAIINPKHIIAITDLEMVAYYDDFYRLDKNERFYINEGQRCYLENMGSERKITYKPHPKYKQMLKGLAEKMKMIKQ